MRHSRLQRTLIISALALLAATTTVNRCSAESGGFLPAVRAARAKIVDSLREA